MSGDRPAPAGLKAAPGSTLFGRFRMARPPSEAGSNRNGAAMALSLVVAFVLWFTFSMREVYSVPVDVPLVVDAVPTGEALAARPPPEVTVRLQGEGWDLLSILRHPPPLRITADGSVVDLATAFSRVGLPAGVAVQTVQPRELRLVLGEEIRRRLPIQLVADLQVDPRFDLLRRPSLRPDSVTVTGARSVLMGLTAWPTAPLVRTHVRDSLVVPALALSDTLTGLVHLSTPVVAVRIPVAEFTESERPLTVEVRNLPPEVAGVRFEPSEVRATYRVPLEGPTYDHARTSRRFVAVVDYADIARDTTSGFVPVAPLPPPGLDIRDVEVQPSRVEYFIQRRPPPAERP